MNSRQRALGLMQVAQLQELRRDDSQIEAEQSLQRLTNAEEQREAAAVRADAALLEWHKNLQTPGGLDPERSAAFAYVAIQGRHDLDAAIRDADHAKQSYEMSLRQAQMCQAEASAAQEVSRTARRRADKLQEENLLLDIDDANTAKGAPQ